MGKIRKVPLEMIEAVAKELAKGIPAHKVSEQTGISYPYVWQIKKWMSEGKIEVKDGEVVVHDTSIVRMKGGPKLEDSDISLWWTDVKSTKPILRSVIEKVGWMQDVIYDVGTMSLFMALMMSDVKDPAEAVRVMKGFSNKEDLELFITKRLVALYEARKDASKIVELEDDIRVLKAQVAMLKHVAEELKKERDELITENRILISLLNKDQLQKYYNTKIFSKLSEVGVIARGEGR